MYHFRGKALLWLGVIATYQTMANSEYRKVRAWETDVGANVHVKRETTQTAS